ncbi:hypothetical protein [Methylobacterium crusticola]|uniref:hypothetical protein n=1 Tax=Methylobacterium crusticola TaxID=1697972 RepID=UPI000FFCC06D|nr:hypothetical protein [Methylobacterium crusticola]
MNVDTETDNHHAFVEGRQIAMNSPDPKSVALEASSRLPMLAFLVVLLALTVNWALFISWVAYKIVSYVIW